MKVIPLALIGTVLAHGASPAPRATDPPLEAEVTLTFVAPLSGGDELFFPESSFSVPRPIVVLDPIVFGPWDQNPGKTAIEQIGPERAINVNGEYGVSSVNVRATVNRQERRYELEAEVRNQLDFGLHNPVLIYVDNPRIDGANVDRERATINGVEVGLRFVDGQLQLDRPIIGVNRTPPPGIPNLVNVTGRPDHFRVEYAGVQVEFGWSYTSGN